MAFGSIERFIGILIEHYAGKFPFWLAPVQVKILSVSQTVEAYALDVLSELKANGIRAEIDARDEKIGFKVRQAQMEKVPYSLIVGQKEAETGTVSVRVLDQGEAGALSLTELLDKLHAENS